MMTTPIAPEEALKKAQLVIPPEVFTAFNELLIENLDTVTKRAVVKQDALVKRAVELMGIERKDFSFKWLNIEAAYEAHGWKVKYDKPAYNESYEAYFELSAKKKNRQYED